MFSIVIPNFKRYDLLKNCINTILNQSISDYEVIIIDNFYDKNEQDKINYPTIRYISISDNLGFSKAVNLGINEAKGDYIAILNNDTELAPDWIKNITNAFNEYPDVLFVTSRIMNYQNKHLFDDVGDVILASGRVYKLGYNEIDSGQYDNTRLVFGASGAASVYKREFFDKVGYFDEDFFAYLEDIDLSFRANLYGYKCLYVPDAIVYHVGSATTGSMHNKFTLFYSGQNIINVYVKNYPLIFLIKNIHKIFYNLLYNQAAMIYRGEGLHYLLGIINGVRMIKEMIPKRKVIMNKRKINDDSIRQIFKENKDYYVKSINNRNNY